MNKYLVVLTATAFLGTSCKTSYEKGFDVGYANTYSQAYDETFDSGVSDGQTTGAVHGQQDGYADGNAVGYDQGYDQAYDLYASVDYQDGFTTGNSSGYSQGYSDGGALGNSQGDADGYADGSYDGYEDSYNDGYGDGAYDGFDDGYTDGYGNGFGDGYSYGYNNGAYDGYNDGYDDGWDDGYDDGLYDMGFAASKNPAIALASSVNSDLVDYASLPKFDKAAAVSSMTLSHADGGSVDLEKLAALKEQFYLGAIKNQIQAKFALSAPAASKIANVVHQFNKVAGSRALTTEDASAFSQNLIGFDMAQIETAVKLSAKGESNDLEALMKDAAGNLDMSPENFNSMIAQIFF